MALLREKGLRGFPFNILRDEGTLCSKDPVKTGRLVMLELRSNVASGQHLVVNWSLSREEVRRMNETVYTAVTAFLTSSLQGPFLTASI
jgi:hypothetical protein